MVLLLEHLDSVDDGSCPLYDEVLETISLVEICVHVLLHGLSWQSILLTLLIILGLLCIDIINQITQLSQSQRPVVTLLHT